MPEDFSSDRMGKTFLEFHGRLRAEVIVPFQPEATILGIFRYHADLLWRGIRGLSPAPIPLKGTEVFVATIRLSS
jgi:hypothetical protein